MSTSTLSHLPVNNVHVCEPKSSTTIREQFTCKSDNVVYHILPRQCPHLYTQGDQSYSTWTIWQKSSGHPKEHWWFPRCRALYLFWAHASTHYCKRSKEVLWCCFQTEATTNGNDSHTCTLLTGKCDSVYVEIILWAQHYATSRPKQCWTFHTNGVHLVSVPHFQMNSCANQILNSFTLKKGYSQNVCDFSQDDTDLFLH